MSITLRWFAFRLAFVALLFSFGCDMEGSGLGEVAFFDGGALDGGHFVPPRRGFTPQPDGGTFVGTDSGTDSGTDAQPVVVPVVDALAAPDTTPPLACESFGPFVTLDRARAITLPTTAYCFKLCPALFEPINPLDYAWTCVGVTDAGRTITVNGQKVLCGSKPLPATVDGAWTFMFSAGGHNGDFINWAGTVRACP